MRYLVAGRLLLPVDPEEHGLLRVVSLHLHHRVVFVGFFFSAARRVGKKEINIQQQKDNPEVQTLRHFTGPGDINVFIDFGISAKLTNVWSSLRPSKEIKAMYLVWEGNSPK